MLFIYLFYSVICVLLFFKSTGSGHYLSFLFIGLVGAFIGSLLHIVINYLPLILKERWKKMSLAYLGYDAFVKPDIGAVQLFFYPSCQRCLNTGSQKRYNLTLLEYAIDQKQCIKCLCRLRLPYLHIEFITLIITLLSCWRFQSSELLLAGLLFCYTLIILMFIDFNELILPDELTLSLLWLGLISNTNNVFIDLHAAVIGAVTGYLFLWGLYWLIKLVTGKEGIGYGDFKLMAALGAWFGWQSLPVITFFGSLMGVVYAAVMFVFGEKDILYKSLPLGSYLSLSGMIFLFSREELTAFYLLH